MFSVGKGCAVCVVVKMCGVRSKTEERVRGVVRASCLIWRLSRSHVRSSHGIWPTTWSGESFWWDALMLSRMREMQSGAGSCGFPAYFANVATRSLSKRCCCVWCPIGSVRLIFIVWLSMESAMICCHCAVWCVRLGSWDLRCGANENVYPQCAKCSEVAWLMC